MIPLMALGSVSKAVDALSSGADWLSKQLGSGKGDSAASSSALPQSFASLLAAHGVGDGDTGKTNPTLPNLSAGGHAHAGASRVGHLG